MLTYMATIAEVIRRQTLREYVLPDWETRLPLRRLLYAPALLHWADATPALVDEHCAVGGRLLIEHLEILLCDFRCAERPPAGDVRRMIPTARGVLSIHAPGLRVYGWSSEPGELVTITAALERDTKADGSLNDTKRNEVLDFIRIHDLEQTIRRGQIYELFPAT